MLVLWIFSRKRYLDRSLIAAGRVGVQGFYFFYFHRKSCANPIDWPCQIRSTRQQLAQLFFNIFHQFTGTRHGKKPWNIVNLRFSRQEISNVDWTCCEPSIDWFRWFYMSKGIAWAFSTISVTHTTTIISIFWSERCLRFCQVVIMWSFTAEAF